MCSPVLAPSGHIHVDLMIFFSTENKIYSFYSLLKLHLTPLSCYSLFNKEFGPWKTNVGDFFPRFILWHIIGIKVFLPEVSLRIFINYKLPYYIVCVNGRFRRLHFLNTWSRLIKLLLCNKHMMQMLQRSWSLTVLSFSYSYWYPLC